jgi:hypothetical protein
VLHTQAQNAYISEKNDLANDVSILRSARRTRSPGKPAEKIATLAPDRAEKHELRQGAARDAPENCVRSFPVPEFHSARVCVAGATTQRESPGGELTQRRFTT